MLCAGQMGCDELASWGIEESRLLSSDNVEDETTGGWLGGDSDRVIWFLRLSPIGHDLGDSFSSLWDSWPKWSDYFILTFFVKSSLMKIISHDTIIFPLSRLKHRYPFILSRYLINMWAEVLFIVFTRLNGRVFGYARQLKTCKSLRFRGSRKSFLTD